MHKGQNATFLGKVRLMFKFRGHETEDDFYVAQRGSLNLLSYPNMQRLGLYIADAEAINAAVTKNSSTSDVKKETVAALQ